MNRTPAFRALSVLLLSLVFATGSFAQGGWKRWGASGPGYNPRTVETVAGEVVSLERFPGGGGRSGSVRLTLKTAAETLQVVLGPAWYVEQQDLKLAVRDQVEITGSRLSHQGQTLLIAAEVKKGDKLLKLRNEAGIPAWASRRWNY